MPRATSIDRRLRYAILPALMAAGAGFAATWLLVVPSANTPPQPAAVLRVREITGNRSEMALDEAVSRLLSSESLETTLTESGVRSRCVNAAGPSEAAETIRESLRVDIRVPDEAGVQEVRIRWVGDPRQRFAGRLVKALARRLAIAVAAVDGTEPRRQHEAARSELGAAETALANARAEFEMALNSPVSARPDEFVPESHHSGAPAATALANSEADDTQLVRQRLAELEQRRRLLADRLMPEHPDMKALDEKIDELGAAIAHRPQPAAPRPQGVATVPTYNQTDEDLDEKRIARSHQLWQAVVEVQNRYAAALAHEHECRRGLAATRGQLLAEIESPSEAVPTVERAAWRRWLLSTFASLLCGGLVLALWPRHRRTFTSAEEVRAVTRLPVVVVESASLN